MSSELSSHLSTDVSRIDDIFEAFVDAGEAPGVAYGVVADGRLVHAGGVGVRRVGEPAQPDQRSIFRIASLTKSFTAAAVLRLRDAGSLGLDDLVSAYVPELAEVALPTTDSPPITIRHLLTMSGGLPTDDAWADRQESMSEAAFAALLRGGVGFIAAPGTGFEYANLGFALLGRVVTRAAGRDYREVVRAELLEPLGMHDSAFAEQDVDAGRLAWGHRRSAEGWASVPFDRTGVFSAIGGIYSTVADLAIWVSGFAGAFPARDEPDGHPLSRASRREMQQLHRIVPVTSLEPLQSPRGAPARALGYGMGLFVEQDPLVGTIAGHPGGYPGYGAQMRWSTELGLGVMSLANGMYARATAPVAEALDLLLAGQERPPVAPWPETVQASRDVQRLMGRWDDALADRIFADNVDLDLPRHERRQELASLMAAAGVVPSAGDAMSVTRYPTPASATWSLPGSRGVLTVSIALTPQRPPRVQTVAVRVADPPVS